MYIIKPGNAFPAIFISGETLKLRCNVTSYRKVNLSWTTNNLTDVTKITKGLSETEAFNSHGKIITSQTYTKILTKYDNNKGLVCTNNFYNIMKDPLEPYRGAMILTVEFPPEESKGIYVFYSLKLHEKADIVMTISGNPRPHLVWIVDGERLIPGFSNYTPYYFSKDGNIKVYKPEETDAWNESTLRLQLNTLKPQDLSQTYYLRAINRHGCQIYHIRLTTTRAPKECANKMACVRPLKTNTAKFDCKMSISSSDSLLCRSCWTKHLKLYLSVFCTIVFISYLINFHNV